MPRSPPGWPSELREAPDSGLLQTGNPLQNVFPDVNIHAHFALVDGADTQIAKQTRPFCGEGLIVAGNFFGAGDAPPLTENKTRANDVTRAPDRRY